MYILKESKQVGTLYHITSIQGIDFIVNKNILKSNNFNNISTTRNKLMFLYPGSPPDALFKIELNGNKLSEKYKIIPTVDSNMTWKYDEQEELIKANKIINIKSYIKNYIFNIDLYNKTYREIFESDSFVYGETQKYYKNDLLKILKQVDWIGQTKNTFKKINIENEL